jgi:hypothetical protein
MSHSFTTYPVLCSTTDDLEPELRVFHAALAKFAEEVTMPEWILFPAASFRSPFDANAQKPAVESNIQMCDFFIQIFGEKAPDPVYLGFVEYAIQCAADPAQKMRRATVLFKDSESTSEDIRKLRAGLADRCDVRGFRDSGDLADILRGVFEGWYGLVKS